MAGAASILAWNVARTIGADTVGVLAQAGHTQLGGWYLSNSDTTSCALKVYDKATAPLSSDTPKLTIQLPAQSAANALMDDGIHFSLGLGYRVSAGIADSDTVTVGSQSVVVNLLYR